MVKIKQDNWNVDYETKYHKVCIHCTSDGFDADSYIKTIDKYIELFFVKNENKEIRINNTNKWWSYKVERIPRSKVKYQIVLQDENKNEIVLRGDTIGTYKQILKLLFGIVFFHSLWYAMTTKGPVNYGDEL